MRDMVDWFFKIWPRSLIMSKDLSGEIEIMTHDFFTEQPVRGTVTVDFRVSTGTTGSTNLE